MVKLQLLPPWMGCIDAPGWRPWSVLSWAPLMAGACPRRYGRLICPTSWAHASVEAPGAVLSALVQVRVGFQRWRHIHRILEATQQ